MALIDDLKEGEQLVAVNLPGKRKLNLVVPAGEDPGSFLDRAIPALRQSNPEIFAFPVPPDPNVTIEEPPPPPTTQFEDVVPSAESAEMVGGFIGGLPPGPVGIFGAGAGAAAARAIRDSMAGDPVVERNVFSAFLRGSAGEATGRTMFRAAGAVGRKVGKSLRLSDRLTAAQKSLRDLFNRFEIPFFAGDVTGGPIVTRLEKMPTVFLAGSGKILARREAQLRGFTRAVNREIDSVFQGQADAEIAGRAVQEGLRGAVKDFQKQASEMMRQIAEMAGDEPFRPGRLLAEAQRQGELLGRTPAGQGVAGKVLTKLPVKELRQTMQEAFRTEQGGTELVMQLMDEVATNEAITFPVAYEIKKQLGELGFRSGKMMRTPTENRAVKLWQAVSDDIDEFLRTSGANDADATLKLFKESYAAGKDLYGSALVNQITRRREPLAPEKILGKIFNPGDLRTTMAFREALPPGIYEEAADAWLDLMARQSVQIRGAGQPDIVSPTQFIKRLEPYVRSGQLDLILPPERAQLVRELMEVGRSINTAERMVGNPSGTAGNVLAPMQVISASAVVVKAILTGSVPAGSGVSAGVGLLGPPLLGRFVSSPLGARVMSEGIRGIPGAQAATRGLGQAGAQAASRQLEQATSQFLAGVGEGGQQ